MSKTGKWLLIFGIIAFVSAVAFGISIAAFGVSNGDWGVRILGVDIPVYGTSRIGGNIMNNTQIIFDDNGDVTTEPFEKAKTYTATFDGADLSDVRLSLSSCHADIICSETDKVTLTYTTGNNTAGLSAKCCDGILDIAENMNFNFFNFGGSKHSEMKLELPDTLYNSLTLDLASGKIASAGITSDSFKANVASGSVEMTMFADDINLDLASGKIILNNRTDDKAGNIKADVASGSVNMTGFGSENTKVNVASGKVVLDGISGNVKGDLASGHLDMTFSEWDGDLDIHLLSGSADAKLPAGSGVCAVLKRLSGGMDIDLDGQNVKLNNNTTATIGGPNVHNVKGDLASGNIRIHN